MLLRDIIDIIESVAPLSSQEAWDNSGLQIGEKEASVSSVLLCTDVTDAIVDEALAEQVDLIISHHPLLFHGLKTIQCQTMQERAVVRCIRAGISIYSSHTPMDCYIDGVSGEMAKRLGLSDYRILHPTANEQTGLGVIGSLDCPMPFSALLERTKTAFRTTAIRYIPPREGEDALISCIAMCGGAGAEFMDDAIEQGAQLFISADWKHHQFIENAGRIAMMDIGHFESEQYAKDVVYRLLDGHGLRLIKAQADESPVRAYV